MAALLGLGLNEAAYMAEIVRAGIMSVDEGQTEAAQALGMRRTCSDAPDRAAAGDAGDHPAHRQRDDLHAQDHLAGLGHRRRPSCCTRPRTSTTRNYQIIPLLIVASIWYLIVTSVLTVGQYYLERYYARGFVRQPPPTRLRRRTVARSSVRPSGRSRPEAAQHGRRSGD